jgi:hypothetical protein
MPLSMTPLLIHSDAVPANIRSALIAAAGFPPERRKAELVSVARLLHTQTSIDCRDACELVGLDARPHC